MKPKDFKKWILKKQVDKWVIDNKQLMEDVADLVNKCYMFEVMYGVPVRITIAKHKKTSGRAEKILGKLLDKK